MAKPKRQTKQNRWDEAVTRARAAAERAEEIQAKLTDVKEEIADSLNELAEMAQEFGEPFDNMSEGLQASPFGQKCEAMLGMDLNASSDEELEDLIAKIDEAEGAEIPLGFGRD